MDEITFGYAVALGSRGYLKGDYITREWDKFYTVFRDLTTGKSVDPNGSTVDVGFVENSQGDLQRKYDGVQLQGSYRLLSRLNLGGNYTWSELKGNVEGESATGATGFTDEHNRPQYTSFAQYNPVGSLDADIRHRANAWIQYDQPLGFMDVNVSVLHRFHSALPYSALGTIDTRAATSGHGFVNPGYAQPPTSVNYYFSERNEFRLEDIHSTDLALNLGIPILGVRLFAQAELINSLGNEGVEDPSFIRTTVTTRRQSGTLQAFNPYTETPVLGTHYRLATDFGQPTSNLAYQQPRTYRFSVGLKF